MVRLREGNYVSVRVASFFANAARRGAKTDCLPFLTRGDDDGVGVGGFSADVVDPRMPFRSNLGSVKVVLRRQKKRQQ